MLQLCSPGNTASMHYRATHHEAPSGSGGGSSERSSRQPKAHRERPRESNTTSARSMSPHAMNASLSCCHVQSQGRLCTTTWQGKEHVNSRARISGGRGVAKHTSATAAAGIAQRSRLPRSHACSNCAGAAAARNAPGAATGQPLQTLRYAAQPAALARLQRHATPQAHLQAAAKARLPGRRRARPRPVFAAWEEAAPASRVHGRCCCCCWRVVGARRSWHGIVSHVSLWAPVAAAAPRAAAAGPERAKRAGRCCCCICWVWEAAAPRAPPLAVPRAGHRRRL